jgi:hypothetical protein
VQISFPTDNRGVLVAVEVMLSQAGRSCNLTTRIDKYMWKNQNALVKLSSMLDYGLTPVISYWSSPHMEWLDGLGKDGQGPCVQDVPQRCAESMRFDHMSVHWYQSKPVHTPLLDVALAAIHEKSFQQDATKQVRPASMSHCKGECLGRVATPKAGEGKTEVTAGNVEWEVVFSIIPVRKTPHFNARVLRHKREGQVLIGERAGNWIRLLREPGWVAIKKEEQKTSMFLVKRLVVYKKLASGSCEEAGMFPIVDVETCQGAAFALGYMDTFPNIFHGVNSKPYGCYVMRAQLFFVSDPENKRNSIGSRGCICTSHAYPTTTITTTVDRMWRDSEAMPTEAPTLESSDAKSTAVPMGHALPTTTITSTTGQNMEEDDFDEAWSDSRTSEAIPTVMVTSTIMENVENDDLEGTGSNSQAWSAATPTTAPADKNMGTTLMSVPSSQPVTTTTVPSSQPVTTTTIRVRTTSTTTVAPSDQLLGSSHRDDNPLAGIFSGKLLG